MHPFTRYYWPHVLYTSTDLKHKIRSHLFNSDLPNTQTYIDTHKHKSTNNELKKQLKNIPTYHIQPH